MLAPEGDACFRLTRASNASSVLFSDVRVKQKATTTYYNKVTKVSREKTKNAKRKRDRESKWMLATHTTSGEKTKANV